MLNYKDLIFFSIKYLGINNRTSSLFNINAILLAMIISIATMSFSEFLADYQNKEIKKNGIENLITINIDNFKLTSRVTNPLDFWNNFSEYIQKKVLEDKDINHVYPVLSFPGLLKCVHRGSDIKIPIVIKTSDGKSKEISELTVKRANNRKEKISESEIRDFESLESAVIIDQTLKKCMDSMNKSINLEININSKTNITKDFKVITIADEQSGYIYIHSNSMWELISNNIQQNEFVKPPRIEVETKQFNHEMITDVTNYLEVNTKILLNKLTSDGRNYSLVNSEAENPEISVRNIFQKNTDLIDKVKLLNNAAYIAGILCAALIFVFIVNNIVRTIDAKQKEIGFLLAGFASKKDICMMFMGNILFISCLSFFISLLLYWAVFLYYPKGIAVVFYPPTLEKVLLGLTCILVFTMFIGLFCIYKISKIDPIKIIQNITK